MTVNPAVVTPDEPVRRAAEIMQERKVGCVPVVDFRTRMHPIGILTARDIVVRCLADRHALDCAVWEHMTILDLVRAEPDTDVRTVRRLMESHRVQRVLVTENGRLAGIIARADLAQTERSRERRSARALQLR
jgi:CBS domain-containing protein